MNVRSVVISGFDPDLRVHAGLSVQVGLIGVPGSADGGGGLPGADGADGASAYEIAVSNGFVGTESEWLASLVGADGADGASVTLVVVTQAEFDAIPSPDPNTLYAISG